MTTLFFFGFFVHEGRRGERIQYHYMRAIIGPTSDAIKCCCCCCWWWWWWWPNIECWLCSFVIFKGIRTSIAKIPYFCDFSGGSGPPVPPVPRTRAWWSLHQEKLTRVAIFMSQFTNWASYPLGPLLEYLFFLLQGAPSQLIFYDRKDERGPKFSDYHITQITDSEGLQVRVFKDWFVFIGVTPITQYTHVRNKIVSLKGAHLML